MLSLVCSYHGEYRPISLLRISLLRLPDSSFSGKFTMYMRLPPLNIKILLESSPPKSRILVGRLVVVSGGPLSASAVRARAHDPRHTACPHIYEYIYIYIYIERERERERDVHIYIYIYVHMYLYVYTMYVSIHVYAYPWKPAETCKHTTLYYYI